MHYVSQSTANFIWPHTTHIFYTVSLSAAYMYNADVRLMKYSPCLFMHFSARFNCGVIITNARVFSRSWIRGLPIRYILRRPQGLFSESLNIEPPQTSQLSINLLSAFYFQTDTYVIAPFKGSSFATKGGKITLAGGKRLSSSYGKSDCDILSLSVDCVGVVDFLPATPPASSNFSGNI